MPYRYTYALITVLGNRGIEFIGEYYLAVNYYVFYNNSRLLRLFPVYLILLNSNTKLNSLKIGKGRKRL